jgi:hypothetical protein
MARRTIGEELQQLFAEHDQGKLPDEEFVRRKAHLLQVSACRLPAMAPDLVGTATKAAALAGGVALAVLALTGLTG